MKTTTPPNSTILSAEPMRYFPWLLTIGGAIGLIASFIISLDKNKLLMNPHYVPSCSINPVISCGSVMKTAQSSVFGFPNSWIGMAGFFAVMAVGMGMFAGAKYRAWYWRLFNLGTLFGVILIMWLFDQSVYHIHALCPWCMVVWSMTIPIFWFTTLYNFSQGYWPLPAALKRPFEVVYNYKFLILLVWYLAIAAAILAHFWYFFKTVI